MTHLLPAGGVPWVHGARSSVPPRLTNVATPRLVCYSATRLQALRHHVAPLMHGCPACWRCRALPLACRPWNPHGLVRRLPVRGVDAWRCAPLLFQQMQCSVGVCAALAAD